MSLHHSDSKACALSGEVGELGCNKCEADGRQDGEGSPPHRSPPGNLGWKCGEVERGLPCIGSGGGIGRTRPEVKSTWGQGRRSGESGAAAEGPPVERVATHRSAAGGGRPGVRPSRCCSSRRFSILRGLGLSQARRSPRSSKNKEQPKNQ